MTRLIAFVFALMFSQSLFAGDVASKLVGKWATAPNHTVEELIFTKGGTFIDVDHSDGGMYLRCRHDYRVDGRDHIILSNMDCSNGQKDQNEKDSGVPEFLNDDEMLWGSEDFYRQK